MTAGVEENATLSIKWPEKEMGTLLCDVRVGKGLDSLFLIMQGGLNYFRVRVYFLCILVKGSV